MQIRLATRKDLTRLGMLWQSLMREHETYEPRFQMHPKAAQRWKEDLSDWLHLPFHRVLVADIEGQTIGFIHAFLGHAPVLEQERSHVYIQELYVLPDFRGLGGGKNLVQAVLGWGQKEGAEQAKLTFLAQNELGARFWSSLGFRSFAVISHLELKKA